MKDPLKSDVRPLWYRVGIAVVSQWNRVRLGLLWHMWVNWRDRLAKVAPVLLWLVGLVVQVFLLWLLHELVMLCIDLFEIWALLARKYLELTL